MESIGHQETSYIAIPEEISINLLNFIILKSPISRFHISFRGGVVTWECTLFVWSALL